MGRPGTEGRTISKLAFIRDWASEHLGGLRHERRVAFIASSLVEITRPWHELDRADIRLLKMASIVHDVGRCVSKKKHPSVGARMIQRDSRLPLKKRQRRALAYLTLRHRGNVPDPQNDPALRRAGDAATLRIILGFLRAADALDSRWLPAPRLTFSRRGRRLRIVCRLGEDSAKARRVFSSRKKFRLLEEMLNCRVVVVFEVQRLRAVA